MTILSKSSKSINEQYEIFVDGIQYYIEKIDKQRYHKDYPEITKLEVVREIGNEERSKVITEFLKQLEEQKLKEQIEKK